jgi:hypothetical protein
MMLDLGFIIRFAIQYGWIPNMGYRRLGIRKAWYTAGEKGKLDTRMAFLVNLFVAINFDVFFLNMDLIDRNMRVDAPVLYTNNSKLLIHLRASFSTNCPFPKA